MNKQIIIAIAEKDIRGIVRSKKLWIPMVILSFVLCILIPAVISFIGVHTDLLNKSAEDLEKPIQSAIDNFPVEDMRSTLDELPTLGEKFVYYFLHFMLIPFFLMTSIIHSMVISASSFAGEKERKTLESLLFAPISVNDLFLGKVLASLIPTLILAYGAFIANAVIVNILTYSAFSRIILLNHIWLILLLWVIPALIIFNILLNVLVSAKVKTFQEAQQFGGVMVFPVIAIFVSQVSGLFFLSPVILILIGASLFLGNYLLLKVITRYNKRNSLFESQIH
ncbi:ABC transporter permease subunit [Peribacillus sp. SCS-155]|uniref:ABC transporter permease subunit n=1 Tax=Peribacillus sedimenti TaxID=3115297 RepID=UPI0039067FFC